MTVMEAVAANAGSRVERLKAATRSDHERVDQSIMAGDPFSSRERYGAFLKLQHAFHRDVDPLFTDPDLAALLPDLAGRRRLALIEQDLADLGFELAPAQAEPAAAKPRDLPTALGWLYVAEGSNLGAAFLLKAAAALGLSEEFGARHLAAAPEGRGLHWRTFTAALNDIDLDETGEQAAVAGAQAAFRRVQELVREAFAAADAA